MVCWSGGGLVVWWLYSGVGDYPLVFVGIYSSFLLCYSRYCCCLHYCCSALMTFIVLPFEYRDRFQVLTDVVCVNNEKVP